MHYLQHFTIVAGRGGSNFFFFLHIYTFKFIMSSQVSCIIVSCFVILNSNLFSNPSCQTNVVE